MWRWPCAALELREVMTGSEIGTARSRGHLRHRVLAAGPGSDQCGAVRAARYVRGLDLEPDRDLGRRRIEPGQATSDLAIEAGKAALKSAGGVSVEAVVLATTTPDYPCPATAPAVASRLGLGGVAAFDVSAVCSGFLYGLATAAGFIAAGMAERVLLIAAEAFSTLLDPRRPDDRADIR